MFSYRDWETICEVIYEECVSPDVYKFIDGEFVIVKHGEYGY